MSHEVWRVAIALIHAVEAAQPVTEACGSVGSVTRNTSTGLRAVSTQDGVLGVYEKQLAILSSAFWLCISSKRSERSAEVRYLQDYCIICTVVVRELD